MKTIITLSLLALVSLATTAKQPHILVIIADDYGWNDIGYHGSEIKTPTLDKLAGEGIKLENYYIQPICTPSRSQLMSGRYQIHTGLQHGVIHPNVPNCLPLEDPTMADKLKELGYSTHIVGKWHLGFFKEACTPTKRGFDSFFGYLTGAEDYFTHTREGGYDLHENEKNADQYKGQFSTYIFSERVQEIVAQHANSSKDQPLFMYMPFQSVHAPLQVPPQYEDQYKHIKNKARRTYAGMVSAMDEGIANITEAYKTNGLWDDTIVIFSTDNGGQVHAGGNNWPLRGWKGSLWEGGVHGVGFVSGGALSQHERGNVNKGLFHISDWFPTLVGLAGGDTSGLNLDGHNVWEAISKGSESPRKELLHNIDPLQSPSGSSYPFKNFDTRYRSALRVGDYKLITGDPGEGTWVPPPQVADDLDEYLNPNPNPNTLPFNVPTDPWLEEKSEEEDSALRFKPYQAKQNVWLFNIKEDPTEHHDLSQQMPALVEDMLNRLASYNATAVPCRYPPPDPKSNPAKHGGYWGPWE